MTAPHSPDSPAPATPVDDAIDLRCPHCDYNLRALTIDRCPECGQDFDRAQLSAQRSDEPQNAVPWDRERSLVAFFKTWKLAAFSPRIFAARFPNAHHEHFARLYAICSSFIACAVALNAVLLLDPRSISVLFGVAYAVAFYLGTGACERTLAALLRKFCQPVTMQATSNYWLGLVRYAGGFKVSTLLMIAGMIVYRNIPVTRAPLGPIETVIPVITLVSGIWWCGIMSAMALQASRSQARRFVAFIAPPVAATIGFAVGLLVLMVVGLLDYLVRAAIS